MEQTNEDQGEMKSFKNVKEDSLIEQVQPHFKEYSNLKNKEVEFPLCEEQDYPSPCVVGDIEKLENEDAKDEINGALFEDSQVTSNHLLEDEIVEKNNSSDLIID